MNRASTETLTIELIAPSEDNSPPVVVYTQFWSMKIACYTFRVSETFFEFTFIKKTLKPKHLKAVTVNRDVKTPYYVVECT